MSFWQVCVLLSSLVLLFFSVYSLFNKRYPKYIRIILLISYIFVGYWLYKQYVIYKTERPFLTRTDHKQIPSLQNKPLIREYLDRALKDRPLIICVPEEVQIKFTDPSSPDSPHAIFQVVFKNQGNKSARNIKVDWNIVDNGNKITSPSEWYKIVNGTEQKPINILEPNQGFVYIYGPEIGAYAKTEAPKIELSLTVNYGDDNNKKYSYYCKSKTIVTLSQDRKYSFEIIEVK